MPIIREYTDDDIDEDMKLTRNDYIKILHHYQQGSSIVINKKSTTKTLKNRAHRILANKLCKCIKPTTKMARSERRNEGRRIGYCTQSIFNSKGLKRHGFQCKTERGRRQLKPRLKRDITKTARKLKL